jgi:transposase
MESTIAASSQPQVTVGVDTHKQFHVAHAVDELGRPLGTHQIPAASRGYRAFVSCARSLGQLVMVGIEGPGHYGAGLARRLRAEGIAVTEVGRPKRQRRARYGKSDDADAAGAAAMVLAGEALGDPKSADGAAEMVRVLRVARVSGVRARAKAYTALQDLLVTAPAALREQLAGRYKGRLLHTCQQLAASEVPTSPTDAMILAIKSLAARLPSPRRRSHRAGEAYRRDHRHRRTPAARRLRRWPRHRRHAAIGDRRQPRPDLQRRRLRQTLRSLPARSLQRQNHSAPTQPRRQPRRQPGPARHPGRTHAPPPTHPRLHHPPPGRRQNQNEIMRCLKRYIAREIFHALHPPSRPTAEIVAQT